MELTRSSHPSSRIVMIRDFRFVFLLLVALLIWRVASPDTMQEALMLCRN